jgi:hypothetical protein
MAAALISITAVLQDVVQAPDPAQQQAQANVTPVNANQAQGAPAPADTVTLTNQAAEGQQTGQDANRGHFDRAAFLGAAGYFFGANARPHRQPPESALPALLQPVETQNAPAATGNNATNAAANAANTAANTAANAAATATAPAAPATGGAFATPQQQLQQLDQSLQQLGINPQSIPLFNRMAMLLYADDPAALRLLVHTLQTAASQVGAGQTATNAAASPNQAAAQALLPTATPANQGQTVELLAAGAPAPAQTQQAAQTQPQTQPQGQTGQGAPQVEVIAAQINFTEAQATITPTQAPANQPATNTGANTQAGQNNALTVRVEELQVAFQAVEVQQGPLQLNGSSTPPGAGTGLNVTA